MMDSIYKINIKIVKYIRYLLQTSEKRFLLLRLAAFIVLANNKLAWF